MTKNAPLETKDKPLPSTFTYSSYPPRAQAATSQPSRQQRYSVLLGAPMALTSFGSSAMCAYVDGDIDSSASCSSSEAYSSAESSSSDSSSAPISPTFANTEASPARRFTRLGPMPTIAHSDPKQHQRFFYIGVRSGHTPGVYTQWEAAERQLLDHPDPIFKTFSTRLAAEAFIAGWDGAGRHSLPPSSPRPLREHLAMTFPSAAAQPSSARRHSYHARLMETLPPATFEAYPSLPDPSAEPTRRPSLTHSKTSWRASTCYVSSPLCHQVDENEGSSSIKPRMRKAASVIGIGALRGSSALASVAAQPDGKGMLDRERPTTRAEPTAGSLWSAGRPRHFLSHLQDQISAPQPSSSRTPITSGLWADARPVSSSPLAHQSRDDQPDRERDLNHATTMVDPHAPKFSRAGLKKAGVVLPTAAPRSSLGRKSSSNSSLSLLTTSPSISHLQTGSRFSMALAAQDCLSALTATSKREMTHGDDANLTSLSALEPPRPPFMRRTASNSSLDSQLSLSSLTSATSVDSSTDLGEIEELAEQEEPQGEVRIRCPDLHGETEASSERSSSTGSMGSVTSLPTEGKKKKGGLFRKLGKAIKF
jgi:hypothetical protein